MMFVPIIILIFMGSLFGALFIGVLSNSLLWRLLSNVRPIKLIYCRLIFHNFNELERLKFK